MSFTESKIVKTKECFSGRHEFGDKELALNKNRAGVFPHGTGQPLKKYPRFQVPCPVGDSFTGCRMKE